MRRLRCVLAISGAVLICACGTERVPIATSKDDLTTKQYGDPWSYGPRQHYVHEILGSDGQRKDVYRYYLNDSGMPVLDGMRLIRRWDDAPGLAIDYRDGHEVNRSEVIITE
jgi:hypothetical protein